MDVLPKTVIETCSPTSTDALSWAFSHFPWQAAWRATRTASRHLLNESPCSQLCLVAQHRHRHWREGEDLPRLYKSVQHSTDGSTSALVMAYTTLAESAYRLCRVSRDIFLRGRRRPLQVARDLRHDKDNNREDHQHSVSPFLFLWLSRRNSEWQWSSIHLGPVCWLHETEWSQTHQVCSIPSCNQRSCWKNGPSSEERSQACFTT